MVTSAQIWKGLFAAVQVTVSPGSGIGGRLQPARSGFAKKNKPAAIAAPNVCRNREWLAFLHRLKVVSNLRVSRIPRNEGSCAEEIDRLASTIVFMRLGSWIVSVLITICES